MRKSISQKSKFTPPSVTIGFERDFHQRGKCSYLGIIDKTGLAIPVSIEITDFDFVEYPVIRIAPQYALPDRKLPHILGSDRGVCYYARGAVVLDRYDPAGTVLQCASRNARP